MLLTHNTSVRRYTMIVEVSDGLINVGAAICHETNGATGEKINHYDASMGRAIARIRLEENPIILTEEVVYSNLASALVAGHKVTLRDIIKSAVIKDLKTNGIEPDNVFLNVVNDRLAEEAESFRIAAAFDLSQKIEEEQDEFDLIDYDEEFEDEYDGVNFMKYIDYSDRY